MKTFEEIKLLAQNTIEIEYSSIKSLIDCIDDDFAKSVDVIYKSQGRVIVSGIGKSAIIGHKIVATLNSTGTPAVFMHAADAIHGDLGIIQKDDVVICLSKSGNTPEIKVLIPLIKNFGNPIIAIVSDLDSYLAKNADFIIKAHIEREACPNNLAPTSSTTAQIVMGDALAVCLLECRNFSTKDFAKYHPGGALGKRLYMRVSDLYILNESPKVYSNDGLEKVILEISSKRLGATAVLNQNQDLVGIITDGDLRRMLQNKQKLENLTAKDIMSRNPKTVEHDLLAINAFNLMKEKKITQLLVLKNEKYAGIIHMHDILKEGIV